MPRVFETKSVLVFSRSVARWSGLVFLSVLMPCLCFYPCLMGIYGAGRYVEKNIKKSNLANFKIPSVFVRKHGICGGMHQVKKGTVEESGEFFIFLLVFQAPPSRPRYSDCSTSTSTPKTSTVSMGGGDE